MMEANGFKKRLMEANETKEFLKLIFQYPSSNRAVVKRGKVLDCSEDSFDFEEIMDGHVTYAYKFLVEIKGEGE